jgi:hypothetical protein
LALLTARADSGPRAAAARALRSATVCTLDCAITDADHLAATASDETATAITTTTRSVEPRSPA